MRPTCTPSTTRSHRAHGARRRDRPRTVDLGSACTARDASSTRPTATTSASGDIPAFTAWSAMRFSWTAPSAVRAQLKIPSGQELAAAASGFPANRNPGSISWLRQSTAPGYSPAASCLWLRLPSASRCAASILENWRTEFNLTSEQIGYLQGAGLFPFAISIILFSLIIDRLGNGVSMAIAFTLACAFGGRYSGGALPAGRSGRKSGGGSGRAEGRLYAALCRDLHFCAR